MDVAGYCVGFDPGGMRWFCRAECGRSEAVEAGIGAKDCDGICEGFAHWGGIWEKVEFENDWGIVSWTWAIFGRAETIWEGPIVCVATF